MNFHDSEKVVGTLISEGYAQVQREEDADLILYNTCSIRDKAEQKVFHRLNDFKKLHKEGKRFAVLGCVAQQEGEKIFERAPHVSLVAGSASYRNLPEMLVQIEAGADRVTGLDDRQTDQTFETEFTARTNPHRGYITIIEGCDKFCAYCVVPYTRGKERSRTSQSVLDEARRMADSGLHRNPTARPKRELLPRSCREEELRGIAGCGRGTARHAPGALHDLASARLQQGHRRRDRCGSYAMRPRTSAGPERLFARAGVHVPRVHPRAISGAHRVDEVHPQQRAEHHDRRHRRFPGRNRGRIPARRCSLLDEVGYDGVFSFKYSPRPNTPALQYADSIPMPRSRAGCKSCRSTSANCRGRAIAGI